MRVDCGAETFLPLCQLCTWRGLPRPSRAEAVRAGDLHALAAHPSRRANDAVWRRRRRETLVSV